MTADPLDLPEDWEAALVRAAGAARVAVVGPTDSGKSTFLHALAARRPGLRLVDLDPGQKMIGAPGTATAGAFGEAVPTRFVFLGSTAVGSFRLLAAAGARLVEGTPEPIAINTPGYVRGAGARLQGMLMEAVRPDLVVAIGEAPWLHADLRIARSALARRKSQSWRRAVRQEAFASAVAGAVEMPVPATFDPAAARPFETAARPVCALADAAGEDMVLGILVAATTVLARVPPRPAARLRLGSMWAEAGADGWELLERLAPAFASGADPVRAP